MDLELAVVRGAFEDAGFAARAQREEEDFAEVLGEVPDVAGGALAGLGLWSEGGRGVMEAGGGVGQAQVPAAAATTVGQVTDAAPPPRPSKESGGGAARSSKAGAKRSKIMPSSCCFA